MILSVEEMVDTEVDEVEDSEEGEAVIERGPEEVKGEECSVVPSEVSTRPIVLVFSFVF